MDKCRVDGRGNAGDLTMIGSEFREFGESWSTSAEGFEAYVHWLRGQPRRDLDKRTVPARSVHCCA
jgi:hypothetical protein